MPETATVFSITLRVRVRRMPGVYQLRTTLRHSCPEVWRRLRVSADTTLNDLHRILESALALEMADHHLFVIGFIRYGGYALVPPRSLSFFRPKDDRGIKLSQVVRKPGTFFVYEYYFGDNRWQHGIELEQILSVQANTKYPACIGGEMSHPPEDCGGMRTYQQLVKALQNPGHSEREAFFDRYGVDYDPHRFDIKQVNSQLRRLRSTAHSLR